MAIELTPEQKRFVRAKIETGRFPDEAAVIAYMLDTWREWEERTAEIRARVAEGIADADAGRGTMIRTPDEAAAFADTLKRRARASRMSGRHEPG